MCGQPGRNNGLERTNGAQAWRGKKPHSLKTARRNLKEMGLKVLRPRTRTLLDDGDRAARVRWCRRLLKSKQLREKYRTAVWIDNSNFAPCLSKDQARRMCKKRQDVVLPGERRAHFPKANNKINTGKPSHLRAWPLRNLQLAMARTGLQPSHTRTQVRS